MISLSRVIQHDQEGLPLRRYYLPNSGNCLCYVAIVGGVCVCTGSHWQVITQIRVGLNK